jgi:hypothetical protein
VLEKLDQCLWPQKYLPHIKKAHVFSVSCPVCRAGVSGDMGDNCLLVLALFEEPVFPVSWVIYVFSVSCPVCRAGVPSSAGVPGELGEMCG